MSAPFDQLHHATMTQWALRAVFSLTQTQNLPVEITTQICRHLEGHQFFPPQEVISDDEEDPPRVDLTLSDDEEDVILTPGPIDSDDDMPVAEAWRRKRPPAAPVKPPARKRARRTVVYSDPESDSESDASDLEDLITYERPIYSSNDREWECDCRVCKRGGLCDGYYEYEYELELSQ